MTRLDIAISIVEGLLIYDILNCIISFSVIVIKAIFKAGKVR